MKQMQAPPCPGCNGTGQMTWFGGVSRFQFSYTDCPECNGFGFLDQEQNIELRPESLSDRTEMSVEQAGECLKVLAQILSEAMQNNEKVQLRGFGTLSCSSSTSKANRTILFSPAKQLLTEPNQE